MITEIEVRTTQGTMMSLPFEDDSSGFVIAEIEGLDPVKATMVSSAFANNDGEQYQSSRRETRNIVMKLDLSPDYVTTTVADLRKRVYAFFMPKSLVSLRFIMDDGLAVDIEGRVETCESDRFSREPAMTISVMCFDPDFVELTPETIEGTTTAQTVDTTVRYDGTVETGFSLELRINRAISDFTIYSRTPDNVMRQLDFSNPLSIGDVLTISTISGAKGATLTRAGNDSSVLYGITPQSAWIELFPGINYFRVYAEGAGIPFTLEYTNKHGGL